METAKEKFIPFEERPSQNVGVKEYIYDVVKFFVIAKLGAMAGYGIGRLNETKQFLNPKYLDRINGYIAAGLITGTYEGFRHWKKVENKRLGVDDAKNLKEEVQKIADIGLAQEESEKQNKILKGILETKYKQSNIATRSHSFGESIKQERIAAEEGTALVR